MSFLNVYKKIVDSIENLKAPFWYFIFTFFSIITIRSFLEVFSDHSNILPWQYFHYCLFYICLLFSLIFLFYFALERRKPILNISRLLLIGYLIIFLAPLVDLLVTGGRGMDMSYLLPGVHHHLFWRFLTFYGTFKRQGITLGLKAEILSILGLSFLTFLSYSRKFFRSLFYTFLMYIIFFLFSLAPFLVDVLLNIFSISYQYSDLLMIYFYLLILPVFLAAFFYLIRGKWFKSLLITAQWARIFHYILMVAVGMVIAMIYFRSKLFLNQDNFFRILFLPLSIIFAAFFSMIQNNLADREIDVINNKKTPLLENDISLKDYRTISWLFFVLSVVYAWVVGFFALFAILLFIACYWLYSMPPLRFKRITFFSKIAIAFNSLILVMLGYVLAGGEIHKFPPQVIAFFLLGFIFPANFIDIKDYKGDKAAGIKTLPVMLGLKASKIFIGISFIGISLVAYFLFPHLILLPFLLSFGIFEFWLINRKRYDDHSVILSYLIGLILLLFYLILV